ncbi:hypothetical protein DPEC_G00102900 [Dallia pectoralis]|uniref:Uncharacterized protein n=1 Tax=Dallia pectoralis TaxID=75939 RepID=A0ACC2GXQ6_DALPE|nr:hypothetical protein DPEC_G00102900 [Dallia pectoralis]
MSLSRPASLLHIDGPLNCLVATTDSREQAARDLSDPSTCPGTSVAQRMFDDIVARAPGSRRIECQVVALSPACGVSSKPSAGLLRFHRRLSPGGERLIKALVFTALGWPRCRGTQARQALFLYVLYGTAVFTGAPMLITD